MPRFLETASAVVTAASLVALVLASALFTRTSWADEPLTQVVCNACQTYGARECTPCYGVCSNSEDGDQCDPSCTCQSDSNYDDVWCLPPGFPFPIEIPLFLCETP